MLVFHLEDTLFVAENMNVTGEEKQLYYKHYFYVAMGSTATQHSNQDKHLQSMGIFFFSSFSVTFFAQQITQKYCFS